MARWGRRRTLPTPEGTFIPVEPKGRRMPTARLVRSLSSPLDEAPSPLRWLLGEFRLLVNRSIRIALREDLRSRSRLTKVAYGTLSSEHDVHKQYIPSAFEVALAVLKAHRRRGRHGGGTNGPYP